MIYIAKLFVEFIILSFIGWLIEEGYALIKLRKFVNRGFFIGPIIPIYGASSIVFILLFQNLKVNIFILFLLTTITSFIIEYVTSFILEKTLDVKLWDYNKKDFKYSFKGRVALETLIPFGLLGVILLEFIHPYLFNLIGNFNDKTLYITAIVLLIIMIIDFILSVRVLKKLSYKSKDMDITEIKSDYLVKEVKKQMNKAPLKKLNK